MGLALRHPLLDRWLRNRAEHRSASLYHMIPKKRPASHSNRNPEVRPHSAHAGQTCADEYSRSAKVNNSPTRSQSAFGKLIASESHSARDCQHVSMVGDTPGSSRSDPAGMMISLPLRVACGSGEPQFRQNEVEKLRSKDRNESHCPHPTTNGTQAVRRRRLPRRHSPWHCGIASNGTSQIS
jgi:hypothetical protein